MTMNWPLWAYVLVASVEFWPAVAVFAAVLLAVAVLARGAVRAVAIVLLLPAIGLGALAAAWAVDGWRRDRETASFEAAIHSVLHRDTAVDGLTLPAGTEIEWRDIEHSTIHMASPPAPVALFGLQVAWLERDDDGTGWILQLAAPEPVDGWTCETINVRVSTAGSLRSCRLAAGRRWKGWALPAGTLLDLQAPDAVELALPDGASLDAPEIGHRLTATGGFSLNPDGSLQRFYFEPEDPLVVATIRLWNTVSWSYDPATNGQGRRRRAVTVQGSRVAPDGAFGGTVVIRLADGHIVREE